MITPWTIYWIGILDNIHSGLIFILAVSAMIFSILLIIMVVAHADSENEKIKAITRKITTVVGFIFIALLMIKPFIPSTKLAAAMYLVPAIVNSENIQAIGNNGLESLRILTEKWLKDLAETKEEEKSL